MYKSKELLAVRYISFFILFVQIFIENNNDKFLSTIFILSIIINNQLRINFIEDSKKLCLSVFIEVIIVSFSECYFGGCIVFYLLGALIDVFVIKNKASKNLLIIMINLISVIISITNWSEEWFVTMFLLPIITFLLAYVEKLYNSKLDAQSLYDKLRISEIKLKEVNKNLENYADSIEELTRLKERNRISREIHDSVGHALSTSMIQLAAMESISQKENPKIGEMARELRKFINDSLIDVRSAVRELKSDEYDSYQGVFRLEEICKNFEKLSGVKIKTQIAKSNWRLTQKQFHHLEKITKESLSNSLKHGKATLINVVINFTLDEFVISFKDNGVGTKKILESGIGLTGIRERVQEMDGILEMKSQEGKGFFIKIIIPKEMEG
ncbi:sensor histidine kinase [Clostridium cibarium]|uniref:histidine kinase n=1 Tax=Clostridium cibarium TaxID=2762247 RepID=A0ABR8PR16_9CLOT|nr:sensor histidine kinase [Clostridium cibarium]MBD7910524.1 sensor histidine kinase [Clostridium cibarium]